jgi:hypothetical protein
VLAMRRSRRRSSWFRSHMAPSSTPSTLRRPVRRRRFVGLFGDVAPVTIRRITPAGFKVVRVDMATVVSSTSAPTGGARTRRDRARPQGPRHQAHPRHLQPASRSHKSNGTRSSGTRRPRRRLPGRPEPEGRHRDHHVAQRPGLTNYVWYIAPDMRRAWVAGRLPTGGIASSVASGGASDGPGGRAHGARRPWRQRHGTPAHMLRVENEDRIEDARNSILIGSSDAALARSGIVLPAGRQVKEQPRDRSTSTPHRWTAREGGAGPIGRHRTVDVTGRRAGE